MGRNDPTFPHLPFWDSTHGDAIHCCPAPATVCAVPNFFFFFSFRDSLIDTSYFGFLLLNATASNGRPVLFACL